MIEIVGEALRQAEVLDPTLRESITELRDVVNTRNRITHGYDSVNFYLLWDIATQDIAPLRAQLVLHLQASGFTDPESGS